MLNERTILVIQDTAQKRQQYQEQIIRTFYVSNADPQEIYNMINQIVRIQGIAITPVVSINKTANTITVRGTPNIVNILEKVIQANDRPRAEIIIDVELLEVNRQRAKEFGLNLAQYQIGAIFSPEGRPGTTDTGTGDGGECRRRRRLDLQPEHDLAGHQHRRLLPDGAAGGRQVPGQRHAYARAGQAAAARGRRRPTSS